MSKTILRLDSSVFGEHGQSTRLNDMVEASLKTAWPDSVIVRRDLTQLPHLDAGFFAAMNTAEGARSQQQQQWVNLADTIIKEVQTADAIVLAAPMYNFSIPSQVKSWLDYLARAGTTFKYGANGAEGLVANKPVFVQSTRGGQHRGTVRDTIEPLLVSFFGFIGITDVRFTFAEGLNQPELKEAGWQAAVTQIETNLAV